MSAIDKCSLPNKDNLMHPIHMQVSQKTKKFLWFYLAFSKFRLYFGHFSRKDDPHSLFISVVTICEKRG